MNIVEHMMLCLMCSGVGLIIGLVCSPNDGNELVNYPPLKGVGLS